MKSNVVFMNQYRLDQEGAACVTRFPDGQFHIVQAINGAVITLMRSENQFLADYKGNACKLLFYNMRPYQVQIEGVFFPLGSPGWQALLQDHPDAEQYGSKPGIILPLEENCIEQIAEIINARFEKYLDQLRAGDKRILYTNHGLIPSDQSDNMFAHHLLYEHVVSGGAFVSLHIDQKRWMDIKPGSDVTNNVVGLMEQILTPVSSVYQPSFETELRILVNECPYCGQRRVCGKIDGTGSFSRLSTEEYRAARSWLLNPSNKLIDRHISTAIVANDSCGCEE